METYEFEFPLKHPKYIIENTQYIKDVKKAMSGNWIYRFFHIGSIENRLYRLFPKLGRMGETELLDRVDHFTKG